MEKLTPEECLVLADVIGDTPTTLDVLDCLKQGMCRAYVFGNLPDITAYLIIDTLYDDAFCFATDVNALWHLLEAQQGLEGLIINVDPANAVTLGQRISAKTGVPVNYHVEIHQALLEPTRSYPNEVIRLLTSADEALLANAPEGIGIQGNSYQTPQWTITTGPIAGAIVNDSIVSIARTYAQTDLHGGISIFTLEEWRGKGYATSAASLVAEQLQAMGKVPIWYCGEENGASLRTAQKLGFVEISRRIDIVSTSTQ